MTGDIYVVDVFAENDTVEILHTFNYISRGADAVNLDALTVASDWWTANSATILGAANPLTNYYMVKASCVGGPGTNNVGYNEFAPVQPGVLVGNQLPQEVCISIQRNTGKMGRSQHGRLFWGPISEGFLADLSNGLVDLTSGVLASLGTLVKSTFVTQTVTLTPIMLSKAKVPSATAIIHAQLTPVIVHRKSRRLRDPN